MAELKLTKNELREQQRQLLQLEQYLPTLQLKKAMLQSVVHEKKLEKEQVERKYRESKERAFRLSPLLATKTSINPFDAAKVIRRELFFENIAGVEIPVLAALEFAPFTYSLFETPPWVDGAVIELRALLEDYHRYEIAQEQVIALEKELREVSIRVNLFEKILIPRTLDNIQRIKIFLGDQQLAAVARTKVAKKKIEAQKHILRVKEGLEKNASRP